MDQARNIIATYVSDMLATDKHIFEAVDRQANDMKVKDHPQAHQLITRIRTTLQDHINALSTHLNTLGGKSTSGVKETVTTIMGMAAGMIDKVRVNPVSKDLRDDYTALSMSAISYTMLHTTGLALKDDATAELANRHLRNIAPLIVEISEIIPQVVVKELADSSYTVDTTVVQQAVENTHRNWSRENIAKAA